MFKDAGIQTAILIATRVRSQRPYKFDFRRLRKRDATIQDAQALLEGRPGPGLEYLTAELSAERTPTSPMTFSADETEVLLRRIGSKGNFSLDAAKEITQGIVPNPDTVSKKNLELIPAARRREYTIAAGDGVFVVPNGKFAKLDADEKAALKPLLEPTDVTRYEVVRKARLRIIYSVKRRGRVDQPPPRLLEHLRKFKEIMEKRRETENGRMEYYHLHWPRSERFFQKGPKILAVRKCAVPTFAYTDDEAYVMMSFNVISSNRLDMMFLNGLLNSDVIRFWLLHRGKMQGSNYQVDKEPLLALPLHVPDARTQSAIAKLVRSIIDRRRSVERSSTAAQKARAEGLLEDAEEELQLEIGKLYDLGEDDLDVMRASWS